MPECDFLKNVFFLLMVMKESRLCLGQKRCYTDITDFYYTNLVKKCQILYKEWNIIYLVAPNSYLTVTCTM